MRIVFMGTPSFAVPVLHSLLRADHEIAAVVTQPDRPAGRKRLMVPPPAKVAAIECGIRVLQPLRLRDPDTVEELRSLGPEVIVVAAFGQILPPSVLAIPKHGCLNVHASLLPKYRGAAPVNAAILAGDELTGVTIMLMEPGLDTGPILAQLSEPIGPEDTALSLMERLAQTGGRLIVATLPAWVAGVVTPLVQNDREATYAPVLRREDGHVEWGKSAVEIERQCRAYYPWPGCYCYLDNRLIKLLKVRPLPSGGGEPTPGRLLPGRDGADVAAETGNGILAIDLLQPEGKRAMSASEFVRGHQSLHGRILR